MQTAEDEAGGGSEGSVASESGKAAAARVHGMLLAAFAGLIYGVQFLPGAIYGQHHNPQNTVIGQERFFFSQYVGIFQSVRRDFSRFHHIV